jgi:hypothetical protein
MRIHLDGGQETKNPASLSRNGVFRVVVETGVEPVNGKSRIDLQAITALS